MNTFIKKLGITLLVGSCFGTAVTTVRPLKARAQAGANSGLCVPAIATGRVRCDYDNGDRYVGNFVNGLPNGDGTYIYSGG
ncbi:MAG: MORN motif-containing protein, partial [Okeania sp. SIO2H7]|nr:MORN motif-containing protein [Okeania sp. SIO2H7]